SKATSDVHYLVVFARLRGPVGDLSPEVARAVLDLDHKLDGQEERIKQSWGSRLAELASAFLKHDPSLAEQWLKRADFAAPSRLPVARATEGEPGRRGARRFLERFHHSSEFEGSGPLIELLGRLPASEIRPLPRGQWSNLAPRDAMLPRLTENPEEAD